MSGKELKICPFCGHVITDEKEIGWSIVINTYSGKRFFQCTECKARGPEGNTNEEAIAAWNRRAE